MERTYRRYQSVSVEHDCTMVDYHGWSGLWCSDSGVPTSGQRQGRAGAGSQGRCRHVGLRRTAGVMKRAHAGVWGSAAASASGFHLMRQI